MSKSRQTRTIIEGIELHTGCVERIELRGQVLFSLGQVGVTHDALALMQKCGASVVGLLHRHLTGDWRAMCSVDVAANWAAILGGHSRVFSSFDISPAVHVGEPITILVITEDDRSVTTILRAEDY